jgi:hypothetical protein
VSSTSPPAHFMMGRPQAIIIPGARNNSNGGGGTPVSPHNWFMPNNGYFILFCCTFTVQLTSVNF